MKTKCPFCGTEIEVVFEDRASRDWDCPNCALKLHGWPGDGTVGKVGEAVVQIRYWNKKALELKTRQEAQVLIDTADWLRDHAATFPDLYEHTNRWQHKRWASKSANALATSCDIAHNCGCCTDSPLEVWPYCEVDGRRVYSDPPHFTVGEDTFEGGDRAYAGWAHKLREAGIAEVVITQVKAHFAEQIERRRLALESALEDADDAEERAEAQAELAALRSED